MPLASALRLCLRVLALLPLAWPSAAAAQDRPPLELSRLTGPVVLDGTPSEAAWQDVAPLPLTMYAPVFRGAPTQRTEIRVAYDDESVYAAGWFYDRDAARIRINSLYRDRWNGDDALAIYVDSFNDNQNAKWFGVTPAGMRFDQLVSDDGNVLNGSWDGFWSARTTVTDSGWFAEVRIPFSTIGFKVGADGRAVMGLTVTRLVSRLQERVTFPEIDPRFEFRRPSLARDVVLQNVHSRTPLYVTPYALAGGARRAVSAPTTGFRQDRTRSTDLGLDVRYPLSGNLTLDVTLNTDFAQVEADEQQVNLDRFPLFFPERRRFFQEGSGVFDFPMGGAARLFNSRRIGLTRALEPVPVIGGARLVGRAGAWDVGLLDMQTQAQGVTPTENFGVLRLRRPVLNPWSNAGLMVTSYAGGGRHNLGLGGDALLRLRGDDYLTVRAASSFDGRDSTASLVRRSHAYATLERRTGRGLAYTVNLTHSGRDFSPELGFLPRRDYTSANLLANRYRFTDRHPVFRRVWPGMLAFSTWRNGDRKLESGQYAVWLQWETKAGGGGWIEPKLFHEDVLVPFTIGRNVHIPAGGHDFADLQLYLSMSPGRRLRTAMDLRSGTYFDGYRTQAILTPTWNASRHLELGADYQLSALRFPRRGESANIHLARLRVRTALDARTSGNAFAQYNSTTRRLDFNVRLRHAFSEGTDLWVVYDEGVGTERSRDLVGARSPLSLARTLLVKYSHTFTL